MQDNNENNNENVNDTPIQSEEGATINTETALTAAPPPPPPPTDTHLRINIEDDMRDSYIDYAMSVIIGRALPDARDGLKPVHRRILYGMYDQGFTSKRAYVKSARTVGEVLGKYHPHGDLSVYDALVRMAQDFSMRELLIDGHGNFGSIDGDSPAAMRYTESRLSKLSEELLRDLEMETVDWTPNFDGSLQEPVVLPSKFPNLLVNGSYGIAVGMATNIPPHNLGELISGILMLIDNPEATVDDLMTHIHGPDFPTGGIIMGREGIISAYKTGRGSIQVRSVVKLEDFAKGRIRIVVTEIPYQLNKSKLVTQIADLIKEKKVDGITDLRDESNREGIRICMELRKGVNTDVILNQLYRHTSLQTSFGVIMLVLVDSRPVVLDLKRLLVVYVDHCREVIRRRTAFQLKKAEERAHILEGLTIALDNLDAVIKLIREAASPAEAKEGLIKSFMLSDKQAQAILDMRLQRLTGLERDKIIAEYHETLALIERLKEILASDVKIREIIKTELKEIGEKYSNKRLTVISQSAAEDLEAEDLMQETDIIITITRNGYIKRTTPESFRAIARGGKGSTVGVKEDDVVEHIYQMTTHSILLVFTTTGKAYWLKGYKIPEGSKQATGRAIVNLLQLGENEKVTALLPVRTFDSTRRIFMVTKKGVVKITNLKEFSRLASKGKRALTIDEGDELVSVKTIRGKEEIVIATKKGYAIRFPESEVRTMGCAARGVKGITFRESDDYVIGMEVFSRLDENAIVPQVDANIQTISSDTPSDGNSVDSEEIAIVPMDEADVVEVEDEVEEIPDDLIGESADTSVEPGSETHTPFLGKLLTVTEMGYGKQTDINKYRTTHRGGKGVKNFKTGEKVGEVHSIKRMFEGDELMIVTTIGKVIRFNTNTLRSVNRFTMGVKLMTLDPNDRVISVARIPAKEEKVD
ncbi:MAG: DNA gyrase subunit A [Candidatus Riflebacteria bacterium]|nr:DNA gyrase subunit A [Candidatus Riflebacteria bacterium]